MSEKTTKPPRVISRMERGTWSNPEAYEVTAAIGDCSITGTIVAGDLIYSAAFDAYARRRNHSGPVQNDGLISPIRIGRRIAWLVDGRLAIRSMRRKLKARPVIAPHAERVARGSVTPS